MGQWGDFGYAEQYHETWSWIVGHFYGHTVAAHIGDPTISVAITENDGGALIATSASAFHVAGHAFTAGQAARITPESGAAGEFVVSSGSDCSASSWKQVVSGVRSPEFVPASTAPSATKSEVLEMCRDDGVFEPIRGDLQAVWSGGEEHTVNLVSLQEYLQGVVPSEVSEGWGMFGGQGPQGEQWGFQSLEAQAVASRSYAAAYYVADGGWDGYADICDSGDCQAYGGLRVETPLTNTAVADTDGDIVDMSGGNVPATTQFSASTGGYTAGIAFPAVPDAGDAVCVQSTDDTCNPNHDWTARIPVASIEADFPSIGVLVNLYVSHRNGLGNLGGRALDVELQGTRASASVDAGDFAADFGLISNWFAFTNVGGGGGGLKGYWLATSAGSVARFGAAAAYGSVGGEPAAPVVAMATAPGGSGYWLTDSNGDVYTFGKASFHGDLKGHKLNSPIVGMAATADGGGYWLVASDGGVFAFGDAKFWGSAGGIHLTKPIVGMAATADGGGYWLVASDGGVFSYGHAHFWGSTGGIHLNKPIVALAAAPSGDGYWFVASDGGVFAFGKARFWGSLGGSPPSAPVVALLATPDGGGYDIVTATGAVYPFGEGPLLGAGGSGTVAIAGSP
jgi:SpoIID/LytB domain protein